MSNLTMCKHSYFNLYFIKYDRERVQVTRRSINLYVKKKAFQSWQPQNLPYGFSARGHLLIFHQPFRSPRLEILYISEVNIYLGICFEIIS